MRFLSFFIMLFTVPAMAQNLINNGTFDSNINDWGNESLDILWLADDGHDDLGAFQIQSSNHNGGITNAIYNVAVEVNESRLYRVSASMKVMPETLAESAVIIVTWLNENQMSVGFNDFIYSDSDVIDGQWHRVSMDLMPPAGMKYAQIALGVGSVQSDSSELSVVRFDDVRFEVADNEAFSIVAAHSGSWYNAEQSGHGLNVEILEGGRAQVYWYTYDTQGNSVWLVASGTHDGVKFMGEAAITSGAMFPPAFDSDDVMIASWGFFELNFTGCHSGVFKWLPHAGSQYTPGEMTISRITILKGMSCQQ